MRHGTATASAFLCAECGRYDRRKPGDQPWLQHPDKPGMWCGCPLEDETDA